MAYFFATARQGEHQASYAARMALASRRASSWKERPPASVVIDALDVGSFHRTGTFSHWHFIAGREGVADHKGAPSTRPVRDRLLYLKSRSVPESDYAPSAAWSWSKSG
jgi:hypothetical protein